jgi:hypothetical protein
MHLFKRYVFFKLYVADWNKSNQLPREILRALAKDEPTVSSIRRISLVWFTHETLMPSLRNNICGVKRMGVFDEILFGDTSIWMYILI